MKKLVILGLLLLMPINIWAYSSEVIPGGENIGITISTKGVTIIGFYKVNNTYNKGKLIIGDKIIKINDTEVNSINELVRAIENNIEEKNKIKITFLRGKNELTETLEIKVIDGIYKTGLYVKDETTGIGTLTYIDPITKVYASLGHEIIENTTKERIEVKRGFIFESYVTGIKKSYNGSPGGKNAKFNKDNSYGKIMKNTNVGIYGIYEEKLPDKELIKIASKKDVKIGKAKFITTIEGNKIKEYDINILEINETSKIKNIYFEITDDLLISKTGGVVQGMSGSPIIQNNKLVGAVTHVIIDNVKTGYGIFIETMLNEGDN